MNENDVVDDPLHRLTNIAVARHPRVRHWWGTQGTSGRKVAVCYICDLEIARWAGAWPMTKSAAKAIHAHGEVHLIDLAAP